MLRLQCRRRAERAHLGHSPALADMDAAAFERLDQRRRHRRAAGQDPAQGRAARAGRREMGLEAEPDRRHAEAHRHALGLEQLVEARAVEPRPGQHQLRPVHRRGIGGAPAAGVKQRHHRADRVARRHRDRVGERDAEGMQHRRAVAVERALGIACRAGGVAERGGGPLVELRPFEIPVLGRDQPFIAGRPRRPVAGSALSLGQQNNPAVVSEAAAPAARSAG